MYVNAKNPEVARIVSAAFPDYTGRKDIGVELFRPGMNVDSYWSSGHRDYWSVVEMTTLHTQSGRETGSYQGDTDSKTLDNLPSNCALVCLTFSGQYKYVRIFVNAENLTPLLPAPVELTDEEKKVLFHTKGKSVYAGITRQMNSGLPKEVWDKVQNDLISKGFLKKNGAFTTEGRNAVADMRYL